MSNTTSVPSFPGMYPFGYDQPATINDQIYATVMGNAERAKQFSESQIYGVVKGNAEATKQQAANDIARDILRAVESNGATNSHITELTGSGLQTAIERNGANGMNTTERVHAQLAKAIERNGSMGMSTTERANYQLATAVERNGANNMSTTERVNSQLASAVDRNGSANLSAIERTTGEARLTTVIADAASRQAANDSTRDVLRTVDRVGTDAVGSTKDSFATLLGTVERNAGESRIQTLTSSGMLDASLRDVRYSILNDINRVGNDLNASGVQNYNALSKSVTDGAWENRSALSLGFQNISEEHLRSKFDLNKTMDCHYSSLLLEQQKLGHFMSAKADGHFASNQLEMQKVKEGLVCQAAQNFSITQLETQKNFAAAQLEAQKNREAIQKDLCDAKYEALKSQQYLGDKLAECCCKLEAKADTIDRDRLRDNLSNARDKNAIYEGIEFQQLFYGNRGYGYGGPGYGDREGGHGHHGHHGRR